MMQAAEDAGWPKLPPVKVHVVYVGLGGAWPKPDFDAPAEVAKFQKYLDELKQRMGETRYNEYLEKLESAPKSGIIIRNVVAGPAMSLIGLLFSSLIIMILGRFVSSQGKYVQIVSAVIHASFVDKLLGNAVRFLLISAKKSVMQTSTSLALLFPRMEVTSPAYVVLGQIDFFQLWMFGILAFGLSSIFKIELKKAMFLSYSFWLLKSLIYIALGIIGLQYLK